VAVAAPAPLAPKHPFYHWTAELLRQGHAVEAVAEIRRLEPRVVLEHALAALAAGQTIPGTPFEGLDLGPSATALVEQLRRKTSG
jgi:hypothetical protein